MRALSMSLKNSNEAANDGFLVIRDACIFYTYLYMYVLYVCLRLDFRAETNFDYLR